MMSNLEPHSHNPAENIESLAEVHAAKVLSVYTAEQLQQAYKDGRLGALIYEANYDYDIDTPELALDVPATAAAVLRQIGRPDMVFSETTKLVISTEEQDEVLSRAVEEELTHLKLTPGMLKTIRERKH